MKLDDAMERMGKVNLYLKVAYIKKNKVKAGVKDEKEMFLLSFCGFLHPGHDHQKQKMWQRAE